MLKVLFVLTTVVTVFGCAPFQPYSERPSPNYYSVKSNDNIHSIAFALEVTPGQLRHANPWVDPLYIEPGTQLVIPDASPHSHYAYGDANQQADQSNAHLDSQLRRSDFIWPLARFEISSHFGRRRGRMHAGIDLRAARGTQIRASAAGRVKYSGYNRGYGHMIVIDHGGGIETAYAHNQRNMVQRGQRVQQGAIIATVGRSGNATGYHVHFEFRRDGRAMDPVRHLQAAL
ncbi:MAG: LysM peptidoglycan-binding domain-containing M23 family metallopeptidase [Gammaproteobacteria bacterium]|nr:LysM peptidoglycan-binding domain-containing M23 family metallopeptidase [Gammaproteobacteria bacterium]